MTTIDKNHELSWGVVGSMPDYKNFLQEVFNDGATPYEKYFIVEEGDIVVDIGANIGLFSLNVMRKSPQKIYCLEPSNQVYDTLKHNLNVFNKKYPNPSIFYTNKAIHSSNGYFVSYGLFDKTATEINEVPNIADGIQFNKFINENNIEYIDFLKVDCEGAEYDIFTENTLDFFQNNVFKISIEIHITENLKNKFIIFRDTFLKKFKKYKVESIDGVDIKWWLFDDNFVHFYNRIKIFIDNRRAKDRFEFKKNFNLINHKGLKEWWRTTKYPTLEFTTSIPKKGCVVDCAFCPQRTLQAKYNDVTYLSLDNFKKIIDKLPQEIRITFSGFVEPWMNKWTSDMLLYAHEKGHEIAVFTTGVGMTLEDVEKIKDIPFSTGPNAGFCLHLPDNELIAKHPITNNLLSVYKRFAELQNNIRGFYVMSMSEVHDVIKPIFPFATVPVFWSRAGNLLGEAIIKPELKDFMFRVHHKELNEPQVTCNCTEELYHNVVLPNGDVSLCCMDYDLKHIIGNILNQEYEEIIPKPFECFQLCKTCENGIDIDKKGYL